MKRILLLLLGLIFILVVGCSSNLKNGRDAYKNYFKDVLKDPKSLIIYKETILENGDDFVKFEVEYGAKNSFGGYVRNTMYFHTIKGEIVNSGEYIETIIPTESKKEENEYPDKFSKCKQQGLFSSWSYIFNKIEKPIAKHKKGDVVILKKDILGCVLSSIIDDMRIKHEFNRHFNKEYYKIFPKGTQLTIDEVNYNNYEVNIHDTKDIYYLPITLE